MPLTPFQRELLATLAQSEDRYLAGGAAMHFEPNSVRFSDDLDFFADSEARVASAFAEDRTRLVHAGYDVDVDVVLPGFVRASVRRGEATTRVDWAHDSAWRFMPLVRDALGGFLLHPIDLAINKVLALAGRDEPRDFVDILFVHAHVLRVAGLVWAAVGKDPGLTPLSLLDLLNRHGRYRPEDFSRLQLVEPFDLVRAKHEWLSALAEADAFARGRSQDEPGCLFWSTESRTFVVPRDGEQLPAEVVRHHGTPGGVVPRVTDVTASDGQ